MKASPPVEAELSWAQVHAFRLARHHLAKRAPKKDFVKVSGAICGLQAQVMSAAELQVGVRADCRVTDVRAALWKHRTLVKTWLMRGTLHLVPASDLPLYTAATRMRWNRIRPSWLKWVGLSELELVKLVDDLGQALDGTPQTRGELIARVSSGRSEHVQTMLKSGWGSLLGPVAGNGLLCFGPPRGQNVTFVRPAAWLDGWHEVDPDSAIVELARRYLRAYGPATKSDFARWWGKGSGAAAWAGLAGELAPVSVEGRRVDLLADDLAVASKPPGPMSVHMLPAFDPYLLGYASRAHLVEPANAAKVGRAAGWISPVVLVDGRIAGTWSHVAARQKLTVTVQPFGGLDAPTRAEIRARALSLADTLGLTEADVNVS